MGHDKQSKKVDERLSRLQAGQKTRHRYRGWSLTSLEGMLTASDLMWILISSSVKASASELLSPRDSSLFSSIWKVDRIARRKKHKLGGGAVRCWYGAHNWLVSSAWRSARKKLGTGVFGG